MRTLQFKNPTFNKGLNCTVRRGNKWNKACGETVLITMYGAKREVKIIGIKSMLFKDIQNGDITYEHDPECRNVFGLYDVMKEVYPNFDKEDHVNILYFEVE